MLKIGKGLKKKKKSKKNKHKEDELFTEEELEQYRREHQQKTAQESEENTGEASEELQKFKLLTAGVDDVLRETQGRLDRIKKESYFQRKPTPSDLKAQEEKERELQKQTKGNWIDFEEHSEKKDKKEEVEEAKKQQQEESDSEYEIDDNDDIFDTTYVDVIASGEVKLAYVPDDDEELDQGPDPFDTSTAEEILKKVEEEERKKKKQISLGVAVEVLTGRAERDKSLLQETGLVIDLKAEETLQANKPKKRPRKIQDFSLLGSFDENSNLLSEGIAYENNKPEFTSTNKTKNLLDDDLSVECSLPESETLINEVLVKNDSNKIIPEETEEKENEKETLVTLLHEFDTVSDSAKIKKLEDEEDFDEFTALAASSVANQKLEEELHIYEDFENDPFDTSLVNNLLKREKTDDLFGSIEGEIPSPETFQYISSERNWSAFEKEKEEERPVDPFDTTFVDSIQPGKCELKLLESEILGNVTVLAQKSDIHQEARILSRSNSDLDFNPREEAPNILENKLGRTQIKVSIQITDPSGEIETQRSSVSENSESNFQQLTLQHRDLLGGSTSDLSKLGDNPIPPNVDSPLEDFSKYSDPFDTSIVEQIAAPGKAELKYIEKELLSDICTGDVVLSDDDFDPRAEEKSTHKVTFNISPEVEGDLLSSIKEGGVRPLTPYYADPADEESSEEPEKFDFSDPFDTAHIISLPGKVEIKLIEKELESVENTHTQFIPVHKKLGITEKIPCAQSGIKHSLSDQDFNPREEKESVNTKEKVVASNRTYSDITGLLYKPPSRLLLKQDKPDLLIVEEELSVKALTPAVEEDISNYTDPFDTSIAENIAPGKAELRVLECELITETSGSEGGIKRSYTDPDFNPRDENQETERKIAVDILTVPEKSGIIAESLAPIELLKKDNYDEMDPFDTSIAANLEEMDFETAKSVNPFLMDDMMDYASSENVASSNPFLSSDFVKEQTGVDNPFLSDEFEKNYDLPDTNPFASFGTDYPTNNDFQDNSVQPVQATQAYNVFSTQDYNVSHSEVRPNITEPVNETRPNDLDLIATSNINDAANDFVISSDEETTKPKRPPPPRASMPKETQDLILSVTGALKATSDHLLDRLPPTRAPSPTAFPDFHSPSPTPDTFTDLLGNEQANIPQSTLTNFTSNNALNILTSPEKAIPSGSSVPPPRPPPARPAPPKRAPPSFPTQPQQQVQEDDMLDLFGTSKPPPPKTKDAILNLYSQPKPQPQDLLLGDLLTDDIPIQPGSLLGNQKSVLDGGNIDLLCSQITSMPPEPDNKIKTGENIENHVIATEETFTADAQEILENEIPKTSVSFEKQVDNTIFSELSVTEQNGTTEENVMDISAQEKSVQDSEEHYIFGTKPSTQESRIQNSTSFNSISTASVPEPEISIFGTNRPSQDNLFVTEMQQDQSATDQNNFFPSTESKSQLDAFDAFAAKFEKAESVHKTGGDLFDPFASTTNSSSATAWGTRTTDESDQQGFGGEDNFDTFLSMSQQPLPPQPTFNRLAKTESTDSDDVGFSLFIKPKEDDYQQKQTFNGIAPVLVPPPKSPVINSAFNDTGPRFNPFDKGESPAFATQDGIQMHAISQAEPYEGGFKRTDSQETPPTPLFDEDVSQPLEDFPRIHYEGEGWEMQLRHPNKKKITGQRFWKKIYVKIVYQGDNPILQLFNLKEEKDPFLELPLQAYYAVSDISAQQYDQFGKIFTVKLQYIFYKERPGVRPGQVKKAERITNKLSQFAAYAIQGDYHGVKEFGSDLKKLGLPVEHAPQMSQLLKLGSMQYEDLKQFSVTIEECLFKMSVHRDRALTYKMEEVQITVVDEIYVEQNALGHVEKQIARVRLFFLGFLSGMPDVELGLNDMWRQGKEVVGRHDIIPVVTEEWIRLEAVEFHACIQQEEYEKTRTIKFKPPDACYIELMRFRIRPPKNRELPLQLKAVMCITGNKVELRADVLVPGFASRKLGQIPCEDVMIRFPIPECWIYLFRVEKHFRYGSVKSAHRRTGKIKGIERFLGAVETLEPSLMEVTSGQAKYEHQHRAIVWRMPRLPKEGQGAYTTHNLVCRMLLTSFDQIPDNLAKYAYVEFTMPATQASHTTVRSVSLCDSPSDSPPEKYVRQLARHEYRVGIEHVHSEETAPYEAAAMIKPKPETVPEVTATAESDSDSSD